VAVETARRIRLLIADEWVDGSGDPLALTSPATGKEIAAVEQGTRADVERAIAAAERAVQALAQMTSFEHAALCHRVPGLLLERKEEIALDLSAEQGKPYRREALPEVEVAGDMFRDAAEWAKRLDTLVHQSSDPAKRVFTVRQARGVYGVLTPWNFPVAIPSEYLSDGLATGNSTVWKPSEWTPLSAAQLATFVLDAGVPPRRIEPRPRRSGRGRRRDRRQPPRRGDRADREQPHGEDRRSPRRGQADAARARRKRPNDRLRRSRLGARGPSHCIRLLRQRGPDLRFDRAHPRPARVHEEFVAGLVDEARDVRLGSPFDEETTMGLEMTQVKTITVDIGDEAR
jgi:succinate-semialdehyde dehydrogenase/glutarate-semialdehyde dehydrogenase